MALPKIVAPEFETTIPSTNQQIKFRPFLVKEEKLLFMASATDNTKDMANAIVRILENCVITDLDINSLASFDIEYLFLQLRAKSVGEVISLQMKHIDPESECKHVHGVEVPLEDIKVSESEGHTSVLQMTDKIGIQMRYPGVSEITEVEHLMDAEDTEAMFKYAIQGIESVFEGEEVYDQFTEKELMEFVDSLSTTQFEKIIGFYDTMPKLRHTIEWTCSECEKTEKMELEGLASFFS